MTLVEVLAATTITAMLSIVVVSLLYSLMGSSRRLRMETDNYESLRLTAGVFLQDTRFAVRVTCDWDYMKLYTNTALTDYIIYKFAIWDGDPAMGTPDSQHLHRWVVNGGVLQRDNVVGWNLVPADALAGDTTSYLCTAGKQFRIATLHMVKPTLKGQSTGAHLDVTGFMR